MEQNDPIQPASETARRVGPDLATCGKKQNARKVNAMKIGLKHLVLTTALAAILAPVAAAQSDNNPFERGRYTAADARPQSEYDPEAIRAGAFLIDSSVGLSAEYNDNVFAETNNEDADTIIRITPQVQARSDWSVHQLNAGLSVDRRVYRDFGSEDATDYNAFVGGRLDATRTFQLTGNLNAGHATEERYDIGSTGSPEPAQNDYASAIAGATYRTDRLQFEGQVGTDEVDYDSVFFNYRDVTETFVSGRASYAWSPDIAFFVQARRADFDYDLTPVLRNATLTSVQVGVNFELSAPFRGEISVGQVESDKDSPSQPDTDALSLDARVQWFPTELTTVTFTGGAGIDDPGLAQTSSGEYTKFSVRADHELLRNLVLFGQIGLVNYDFSGSGVQREDELWNVAVGGRYKLNKHAHLEFGYGRNTRDTNETSPPLPTVNTDLAQNVFRVGIRLFP